MPLLQMLGTSTSTFKIYAKDEASGNAEVEGSLTVVIP